jgi:hypothetical protein
VPKVILISGLPRSGTTLLGHLLGQIEGFLFAGELNRSVSEMSAAAKQCGCGAPLRECSVWRPLFAVDEPPFRRHDTRARALARQMLRPTREPDRLYDALARSSGARVIVDSSKGPGYAAFLRRQESIELTLVQVVREPLAIATSIRRRAARTGEPGTPLLQVAAMWALWHPLLEAVAKKPGYVRVRYSAFAADPRGTLETIARAAGEEVELGFLDGSTARLEPTHSAGGNRSRFAAGEVEIVPDESWRTDRLLRRHERGALRALTLPTSLRYGG